MGIYKDFYKLDDKLERELREAQHMYEALRDSPQSEASQAELIDTLAKEKTKNTSEFLDAFGNWYLQSETELEKLKTEYAPIKKAMAANIKALEERLKFIKFATSRALTPGEEFVDEAIDIQWRRGTSLKVEEPEAVPIEFCLPEPPPDNSRIKAELEAGGEVAGCRLEITMHPQFKPGGANALKNQRDRQRAREKEAEKNTERGESDEQDFS